MACSRASHPRTAELPVIDLQALLAREHLETARLLAAAQEYGFFYLDLRGIADSEKKLKLIEDVYAFEGKLFDSPPEELIKYDVDVIGNMKLNGYKPKGRNIGGVNGGKDGFESYAVPKDGVFGLGDDPFLRPPIFDQHMSMLRDSIRFMQDATLVIHRSLSEALELSAGERFEDFHHADQPSPCMLRLLKYHAQPAEERGPPQTPHTDLGSLTLLFTKQPGLQVLATGAQDWRYILPKAGHAVINIGDGMSMMTNGLLKSSLHRVVPPPNRPMATRYSFAFLQRAEAHTSLAGLRSPLIPQTENPRASITSGEWLHQKFAMLRAKTHDTEKEWVLTGR